MLDSACEAMTFVYGRIREDLDRDGLLVLSLVKGIGIIGEAAYRVDSKGFDKLPNSRRDSKGPKVQRFPRKKGLAGLTHGFMLM